MISQCLQIFNMHTITTLLLVVLSNRVLCNPITYLNDDQPRPEDPLSNLPCRPLSGDYDWQMYINATEPQDYMPGNRTIFANASTVHSGATETLIQRVSLLSTATLASSVAQPTGVEDARCQIITQMAYSDYTPTSIDLGPFFLRPAFAARYFISIASSYPVFRVTIRGRLPDTPDIPHSYWPILADNSGIFSLQRALWVKISIAFGSTEPKRVQCTLWEVISSNQDLVAA